MDEKVLTAQGKKALQELSERGATDPFYLAGGTAAALHLGHRISSDLDFFSEKKFDREELFDILRKMPAFSLEQKSWGTLLGKMGDTRISFFYYPYLLLEKPAKFLGVRIASPSDLCAMKIWAIADRGKKRDFYDLYFLLRKYPLEKVFEFYNRKYKNLATNKIHILRSLVYFVDAEKDPDLKLLSADLTWEKVKEFFERTTKELVKSQL